MKNNTEKIVHSLQEITTSASLKKRIAHSVFSLPSYRTGFNYPLIAFRLAFSAIVLVTIGGGLSGIVVAAKGSSQRSVLFPLKKAIVETQIHFAASDKEKETLREQIQVSIVATVTPSLTPTPEPFHNEGSTKQKKWKRNVSREKYQ